MISRSFHYLELLQPEFIFFASHKVSWRIINSDFIYSIGSGKNRKLFFKQRISKTVSLWKYWIAIVNGAEMPTVVQFELFITAVRFLGITDSHLFLTQQEKMNFFTAKRPRYQLEADKFFEVSCKCSGYLVLLENFLLKFQWSFHKSDLEYND